jgi:hypothetical protein
VSGILLVAVPEQAVTTRAGLKEAMGSEQLELLVDSHREIARAERLVEFGKVIVFEHDGAFLPVEQL